MGDFMKKFVAPALVLLLLCLFGCGGVPIAAETTVKSPTTEVGGSSVPPEQVWYPYTEFDERLQPGYTSVNALAERFGEPKRLLGEAVAPDKGVLGLTAEFEGVRFELWDGYDDDTKLSYNMGADFNYSRASGTLEENDKALRLELAKITVAGADIPLPRGIRIGDGLEQVRAAYQEGGYLRAAESGLTLTCNYYNKTDEALCEGGGWPDWPYGIVYYFGEDEKLAWARISWFSEWERFGADYMG
jgi:hypothetical protein